MTIHEEPATSPEPRHSPGRESEIRKTVHRLALAIAGEKEIPPGDRAALRRQERGPAFWKVAVHYLEPAGLLAERSHCSAAEAERRWAAILAGLAHHAESHLRGRRLGVVLAEADVAEARVLRLARARGESLLRAVRAVAHQLGSGGARVDWADFADLILSDGAPPWEDEVRRRLCRDFYRTHDRGSRDIQKEES
jgi:CRISPR type I-E-associated protein CasB/Cse2